MLIFSFEKTLMYYLMTFLPFWINSVLAVSVFRIILSAYSFLVNFVLFFVAFYYACDRGIVIQEKPAGTLISILVGGFVGTWIGGLTAPLLLPALGVKDFSFTYGLSMLPSVMQQSLPSDTILAIAAMLSSWFVLKWDEKLMESGFKARAEAPPDIILVSVLYAVFGILSLCILPLLIFVPYIGTELWSLWLIATLFPLVAVNAVSQIAVAVGLYKGKRWGWLTAFAASMISICFNAVSLTIYGFQPSSESFSTLVFLTVMIIALVLNIITIIFLLTSSSRHHCRIVNPTKPSP
ncbi:hypothetical protein KEJ45_06635 [Candidatus Bathyarchaeota archaeon]|nr:hypothetical protein [Candidatus Bathyarchaeota archaeon]